MNIGTLGAGDLIRQTLASGRNNTQSASNDSERDFHGLIVINIDKALLERMESKRSSNDRWTTESLYNTDIDTPKGYTVNKSLIDMVRNKLKEEGIDADKRTPTHEITDEQMDWFSERYEMDFLSKSAMEHSEFGNFILDLVYQNVISPDEVEDMFGVMPINANNKVILYHHGSPKDGSGAGYECPDGSIVEDYQELRARLYIDYLKSQSAERSESECRRAFEIIESQRSIITDFFSRFLDSKKSAMVNNNLTYPLIEDASEKLKEDFGSRT